MISIIGWVMVGVGFEEEHGAQSTHSLRLGSTDQR